MTRLGDDAKSWAASLGLHGLLFLIMLLWVTKPPSVPVPLDVELLFAAPPAPAADVRVAEPAVTPQHATAHTAATHPARARQASARAAVPARSTATAGAARAAGTPAGQGQTAALPAHPRSASNAADYLPTGDAKSASASGTAAASRPSPQVRDNPAGTGPSAGASTATPGPSASAGNASAAGTGASSSASISWSDGSARSRIAGRMPAFPQDVNREAQIKVRFIVHPDGSLGALTVLQKGEPRFEQAALGAMGSWRFNALPASVEQKDQTGVATFNFRLR